MVLQQDERANPSAPSRRTANYQPTIWDDSYIQSLPVDPANEAHVDLWEKLKVEVRDLIHDKQKDIIELLELVDMLRQLGVSYHYESEIKQVLGSKSSSIFGGSRNVLKNDLHGSSLFFRLIREYGINISDLSVNALLSNFKNESRSFKDDIVNDVKGMLSLYEASYLGVEGEDELDEAREFTSKHLRDYLKEPLLINPQLVEQIDHALELPLHWRMPRLHTRWFIDAYERQENMNPKLLEFAKLDFNMLQRIYKKEFKEISRWWRNLGLVGGEFSFARDRAMEIYLWSLGCTFEPQFWRCRKENAKLGCLLTTIDDIYDIYGSLEELQLFTNAVDEWKITSIHQLPNYMRVTLEALFSTVNDIANAVSTEKGINILPHLKKVWGVQCKAFLVEAIWYYTGYTPKLNEYLENAWLTITGPLLQISAYCLSEVLTKEALKSLDLYQDVVRYSAIVARFYDDLGTSTDELQRGDVPKSIQCYMNERNVSESVARDHIHYLIKKYWKRLNGEQVANSKFEETFNRYVLNFPRMAQSIYQNGDGFGKPGHESRDRIIYLLIKPIVL